MLTRRTATVIMSAPEASCARTMIAGDPYLPVPTINRDVNVRPAMVKLSNASASADEVDDFDEVAVADHGVAERGTFDDGQVVLDRNTARVDCEVRQKIGDRQRRRQIVALAVQHDRQRLTVDCIAHRQPHGFRVKMRGWPGHHSTEQPWWTGIVETAPARARCSTCSPPRRTTASRLRSVTRSSSTRAI